LFSDRCGVKDIEKLEEEYAKDLKKTHLLKTKNHLHRFLKGTNGKPEDAPDEKPAEDQKKDK